MLLYIQRQALINFHSLSEVKVLIDKSEQYVDYKNIGAQLLYDMRKGSKKVDKFLNALEYHRSD
jgi:hypothetical protein